jgi:hypothetical protein
MPVLFAELAQPVYLASRGNSLIPNNSKELQMNKEIKEISKLDAAAFLRQQKFRHSGFEVRDKIVYFKYEDTPELNQALDSYLNKTARVDPNDFNKHMRIVLHLVREILREVGDDGK